MLTRVNLRRVMSIRSILNQAIEALPESDGYHWDWEFTDDDMLSIVEYAYEQGKADQRSYLQRAADLAYRQNL
jgi:hypothetical protein